MELRPRTVYKNDFLFKFYLNGKPEESFEPKISKFFEHIHPYFPFLKKFDIKITSENTFPHSSGIASSASGMAALALCILSVEELLGRKRNKDDFFHYASYLARIGSGSASRSIDGPIMLWGKAPGIVASSDCYAIKYPYDVSSIFNSFHDTILLIDENPKEVSSSQGHSLMKGHPFAKARFNEAHKNIESLKDILKSGDVHAFGKIAEQEALMLHALMMTSSPYYMLMKPGTVSVIEHVWQARKEGTDVYFTLDAGANIHLLYPKSELQRVDHLVRTILVKYCQNGRFITDKVGPGAVLTHSKIKKDGVFINTKII